MSMSETGPEATIWAGRLLVLGLLGLAAYTDYRERRIPNPLVVALLSAGLLWHSVTTLGDGLFSSNAAGSIGIIASLLGALIAFASLFPLYCLRVLGAGDVKLATALGAWVGWQSLLAWVLLVMLSGGVLSLLWMVDSRRRSRVLSNLRLMGVQLFAIGPRAALSEIETSGSVADRLPYAWAMLAGTIVFAAAHYLGWGHAL